jgi:hypothetical protein
MIGAMNCAADRVADLSDHVEKLIGAWKALLPVIAVVAGGTFWFATTLYERELRFGAVVSGAKLVR